MNRATTDKEKKATVWLWLSLLICILDLITKRIAEQLLEYAKPVSVWPIFDLTLLYNPGAAFSFLAMSSGWQRYFLTGLSFFASVFFIVWLTKLPHSQKLLPCALACVLGGALGNLYDRIVYGQVTDFLSFHWQGYYFPAFNIADSAITIGAILLLIDAFYSRKAENMNGS